MYGDESGDFLLTRRLTPQQAMKLNLQTHGEPVGKNPFCQGSWRQRILYRRKQDGATASKLAFNDDTAHPVVICAIGNDKFKLIVLPEQAQIFPTIFCAFSGRRRLKIDDTGNARINFADRQRPGSF